MPPSAKLEEYKEETKVLETWLASTAKHLGINLHPNKSDEQEEDSHFQKESEHKPKYKIRSEDWITIAKAVANSARPDIPDSIIHTTQRCTLGAGEIAKNSAP